MSSGLAALLFTEDADVLSDTFEASYVAATSVFLEAVVLSMSLAAVFLPVTHKEYDEVVDYAIDIGVTNGFIQEGDTAKESFIPDFDFTGLI